MDELTINQMREVLNISYPTALGIAKEHGRFDTSLPPSGQWLIPYSTILDMIEANINEAVGQRNRLSGLRQLAR